MRCPYCKSDNDRVIDSRASADGFAIRRRRMCRDCARRYTTYERVEGAELRVVKKSGERVEFERGKILGGLLRACEKRPITTEQLERIVDDVERQCLEAFDKEVPSKVIGELIMEELRQLDQVAYVRFASVYRDFKDVNQFLDELETMLERGKRAEAVGALRGGRVPADLDARAGVTGIGSPRRDVPDRDVPDRDVPSGGGDEETGRVPGVQT
jgi:transcriptional repressor NrdR